MTNRFDSTCIECRGRVLAGQGRCDKNPVTGKWEVEHLDPAACALAKANPQPRAPRNPLPDVAAGHYATASRTGNNDLDFWRVDRPAAGKWAGYTFVKRVIGGHPDTAVRGAEARSALDAILAAGIDQAAVLYGQTIGRCYRCNRTLTDETSRQLGIGPDCRGQAAERAA